MILLKILFSFILLGIGLQCLMFALLTPYYALWVGDAPSYSDEHIRNHVLMSLVTGAGSAVLAAASLYGAYSLFWNKINI